MRQKQPKGERTSHVVALDRDLSRIWCSAEVKVSGHLPLEGLDQPPTYDFTSIRLSVKVRAVSTHKPSLRPRMPAACLDVSARSGLINRWRMLEQSVCARSNEGP